MKISLKSTQIKANEFLFFLSYGLFLIFGILSTSFFYKYFIGNPYKIIIIISIIILLLKEIFLEKYNIKSLLVALLFVLLILITWNSGIGIAQKSIPCMLIFIYSSRKISFMKIAKFTVLITIFLLFLIIFSSKLGIIMNYISISKSGRIREYLGFRYTLFGPAFLFNITSLIIYIYKEKIKWVVIITLFIMNYFLFLKTNSRLSFYLSICLIIISVVLKVKPNIFEKRKFFCYCMIFSFFIGFFIAMHFTINFNPSNKFYNEVNSILENRLYLGQKSLIENGINLFGQKITWVGNGLDAYGNKSLEAYTYVDSFYIQVLQKYGLIYTIIIGLLYTYTNYKNYKNKDFLYLLIISLIAFNFIINDLSLSLYYNTFWFPIVSTITKSRIPKRSVKNNNEESKIIKT